jgi:acetyl-CoA carboxylase biotin carboxylase subunit
MFKKVLIANRGEIAVRIVYALREMGLESVAVYSDADENALHVQLADYSVKIGPPPPRESYLHYHRVIAAAEVSGAEAIHPGYGFLAENAEFARLVRDHGLVFIGPPPEAIEDMGDKAKAKESMKRAGVPVVPGSDGPLADLDQAREVAEKAGYPVLLKAVAGGGGRGMRIVREPGELEKQFQSAGAEAESAFGDGRLYLEKLILRPRHIEVQVLADSHGNIVYLGERECSIQRRHQKLIEESPSPVVSPETRKLLGESAVRGASAIGYVSAGTVEFIMDQEGNFYFIEMNTRVQVEHPVTEMVTGVDIIKEQIRIAAGEKLSMRQEDVVLRGHAIEARINAEDPVRDFAPSPGTIKALHKPGGPGIRVDSHIYQGYKVPPYYDSLLAKLIAHGSDRNEAIARMLRALEEFVIEGVPTTIPFHHVVISSEEFRRGDFDTGFLERFDYKAKLSEL